MKKSVHILSYFDVINKYNYIIIMLETDNIKYSLYTRYFSKHITWNNSLNLHNIPVNFTLKQWNCVIERFEIFFEVTQCQYQGANPNKKFSRSLFFDVYLYVISDEIYEMMHNRLMCIMWGRDGNASVGEGEQKMQGMEQRTKEESQKQMIWPHLCVSITSHMHKKKH